MIAALAGGGRAMAADLGPYGAAPRYYAPPPSPCLIYQQAFNDGLRSIRQTARLYRSHYATFHRLKRGRHNDGFTGPDIALNQAMTAEQIDVAVEATQVAKAVAHARQLRCFSAARLNEIDNAATRFNHEIAEDTIWFDPRSFY
jgi:hypothetical protein